MTAMTAMTADRDALRAAREWHAEGVPGVLATLVAVEGHAYRRPGARLAYSPEEGRVGALTAGCAEARLADLADSVDEPRVETFDLSGGDAWGFGARCNGTLDVLVEPVSERLDPVFDALDAPDGGRVATVVEESAAHDVGDRLDPDELGVDADGPAVESVRVGGLSVDVFVDRLSTPPELVVVGTGPDAAAVVEAAASTRFDVTLVGFRGAHATPERFPAADRVVSTSPRSLAEEVSFDESSFAVVMTHDFVDDRLALEAILDTDAPYVGVMGPRSRMAELRAAGDVPESDALYAPVGLDVGGDAPGEVAHSIVAEALAVHSGRTGGHLRNRERIHERP